MLSLKVLFGQQKYENNRLLQLRLLEPQRQSVENYTPLQEVLVVVRMRGAFNPARERGPLLSSSKSTVVAAVWIRRGSFVKKVCYF